MIMLNIAVNNESTFHTIKSGYAVYPFNILYRVRVTTYNTMHFSQMCKISTYNKNFRVGFKLYHRNFDLYWFIIK